MMAKLNWEALGELKCGRKENEAREKRQIDQKSVGPSS